MTTGALCDCGRVIDGSRALAARHFEKCSRCRRSPRRPRSGLNVPATLIETAEHRQVRLDNNARIETARQRMTEFDHWLRDVYFVEQRLRQWTTSDRDTWIMREAWEAGRQFELENNK